MQDTSLSLYLKTVTMQDTSLSLYLKTVIMQDTSLFISLPKDCHNAGHHNTITP